MKKIQWTHHFQNGSYFRVDCTSDLVSEPWCKSFYLLNFKSSHCRGVKTTAAVYKCITCFALAYSGRASTQRLVWNGWFHTEAFDAVRSKKKEKLVSALSDALAAASRQLLGLTVTAELTALLPGLSWRQIIEYHVTRPVTARRSSSAACSVRSRGPVTCRLATTRGPQLPAREQSELAAVESNQKKDVSSISSVKACRAESVFNLGSGFEHMVKDHHSLLIFSQIEDWLKPCISRYIPILILRKHMVGFDECQNLVLGSSFCTYKQCNILSRHPNKNMCSPYFSRVNMCSDVHRSQGWNLSQTLSAQQP